MNFSQDHDYVADGDVLLPYDLLQDTWDLYTPTEAMIHEGQELEFPAQGYEQPLMTPTSDWSFGQTSAFLPSPTLDDYFNPPAPLDTNAAFWPAEFPSEPLAMNFPHSTRLAMPRSQPRPPSHSRSQSSPLLPAPSTPANGQVASRRPRERRLTALTRENAAATRRCSACIFHKIKRTTCGRSLNGDQCDDCIKFGRICYRFNRLNVLHNALRNANDTLIKLIVEDAPLARSSQPLRFHVNILPKEEHFSPITVDLRSSSTVNPVSCGSDTGELDPKRLLEIGYSLLAKAGVKQTRHWDGEDIKIHDEVWDCMSHYVVLKLLPAAAYNSSGHQSDIQAVKRFVATLVQQTIHALRRDMASVLHKFKEIIDNKSEKLAEDPGHYRFVQGFAMLCYIAEEMRVGQTTLTDKNNLAQAVCGAIYPANGFSNELRELGCAFLSIKDATVTYADFDKLVIDALPDDLMIGLSISYDPAQTESALTLQGRETSRRTLYETDQRRLPYFMSEDAFTGTDLPNSYPLARLYGGRTPELVLSKAEESLFQFQYGTTLSTFVNGDAGHGAEANQVMRLPVRGATSQSAYSVSSSDAAATSSRSSLGRKRPRSSGVTQRRVRQNYR